MGRRKSLVLRLLPPRKTVGNAAVRFPWQAKGTPPAALHVRREQLLKMNLVAHVELREEWTALIQALDTQLQSELTRSRTASPGNMSAASSDTESHSAAPPDMDAFVSEYLDDSVAPLPLSRQGTSPSSPSRESSRENTNPLTVGILPGTMPEINVFLETDFTPSAVRIAEAKAKAEPCRAATLTACRPALLPMGPAQARPHSAPDTSNQRSSVRKSTVGPPRKKRSPSGSRPTSTNSTASARTTTRSTATARTSTGRPASAAPTSFSRKDAAPGTVTQPAWQDSRKRSTTAAQPPKFVRPASTPPRSSASPKRSTQSPLSTNKTKRTSSVTPQPIGRQSRCASVTVWATPDVSICGRRQTRTPLAQH
eukprot:m.93293 g.93293  ORF g.93293 m.93293 type:complete len:368 (+) comp12124_c0_seq2:186-1289(+)